MKRGKKFYCPTRGSNPGPLDYEVDALLTELLRTEILRAKNYNTYTYYMKIENFNFKFNYLKGPSIDFFLKHVSKIYYVPSIQNVPIFLWALKLGLFSTAGGTVLYFRLFEKDLGFYSSFGEFAHFFWT